MRHLFITQDNGIKDLLPVWTNGTPCVLQHEGNVSSLDDLDQSADAPHVDNNNMNQWFKEVKQETCKQN